MMFSIPSLNGEAKTARELFNKKPGPFDYYFKKVISAQLDDKRQAAHDRAQDIAHSKAVDSEIKKRLMLGSVISTPAIGKELLQNDEKFKKFCIDNKLVKKQNNQYFFLEKALNDYLDMKNIHEKVDRKYYPVSDTIGCQATLDEYMKAVDDIAKEMNDAQLALIEKRDQDLKANIENARKNEQSRELARLKQQQQNNHRILNKNHNIQAKKMLMRLLLTDEEFRKHFNPRAVSLSDDMETGMNLVYLFFNLLNSLVSGLSKIPGVGSITAPLLLIAAFVWNMFDTAGAGFVGNKEGLLADDVAKWGNYGSAFQLFLGTLYSGLTWLYQTSPQAFSHWAVIASSAAASATAGFCFALAMLIPYILERREVKKCKQRILVIEHILETKNLTAEKQAFYKNLLINERQECRQHEKLAQGWLASTVVMTLIAITSLLLTIFSGGIAPLVIGICLGIVGGIISHHYRTNSEVSEIEMQTIEKDVGEKYTHQEDLKDHKAQEEKKSSNQLPVDCDLDDSADLVFNSPNQRQ